MEDRSDSFGDRDPSVDWIGIDVADSPAARKLTRAGGAVAVYDGVEIPFPPASFDMVYSRHVLEHVRRPLEVLRHVRRTLKPTGYYAGSVSQFEPYHGHIMEFHPTRLQGGRRRSGTRYLRAQTGR